MTAVSARPLIGLSGRRKRGADVAGFPDSFADVELDLYVSAYAEAVTAAGGLPVHLPQHVDPAAYAGHLDGVLLTGGADVDPVRYGAAPDPAYRPESRTSGMPPRWRSSSWPWPSSCPCSASAAACNCSTCGPAARCTRTSRFTLATTSRSTTPSTRCVVEPGSRLEVLHGGRIRVNSLHHQTVERVADGWVVTARSGDGTIEALEWPGHDLIAVQWHPELLAGAPTDPLFAWLVERARARALADAV